MIFRKANTMHAHHPKFTAHVRGPLLALACVLLAAGPAAAADEQGRFAVRGVGSDQCGAFQAALVAKDAVKIDRYGSWLMGYLTASNRLISRTFDAVPSLVGTDMVGMVSVICRTQPATLLETAAAQALSILNPIRLTADSPIVNLTNDGKSLSIRTEAVVALQRNLAAKGGFKGLADGKPSPQLTKAIIELQQKEKIPVTGLPDIDTQIRAGLKK